MALKKTCKNGHPFTEDNVVYNRQGHRRCKTCKEATDRQTREKRRLERLGLTAEPPPKKIFTPTTAGLTEVPGENGWSFFYDENNRLIEKRRTIQGYKYTQRPKGF